MDVSKLQKDLESEDPSDLVEAFATMSTDKGKAGAAMDRSELEKLMPLCVGKLKHDDITVRAGACQVIADQLRAQSTHMSPYLVAIVKSLCTADNVDLSQGKENKRSHAIFHKNSCDIITEVQYKQTRAPYAKFQTSWSVLGVLHQPQEQEYFHGGL